MQRIYLNDDWYFTGEFTNDLLAPDMDMGKLQKVRVPHTVCETPYHYFDEKCYQMVSGYRRTIHVEDAWRKGHLILTFEGAAHEATVYINGQQAVKHYSGYTAFSVDIVPYLAAGSEQIVAVRLDSRETLNQPPFGKSIDYMTYGGIYRDVYLDVKNQYYITDIYAATPDALKDEKTLKADVTVNEYVEGLTIAARLDTWTEIPAEEDEDLQHWDFEEADVRFRTSCLTYKVNGAELWDVEMPYLYVLSIDLKKDGVVVDTKKVRVGFREAVFEADGFWLNGRVLKLRGLNRHQSWPYVGYAMPKSPQQLDADLLKWELGANMVRTSHYPQSQHFIDRCDEVGILVFTEIPGWQHIGDTRWKKIAVRNVREMITQYRNHPSVILWGVRINESADDNAFYYKTNQVARELDVYRQTSGVRNFAGSYLYEDVYAYNDFSQEDDYAGCKLKSEVTSDEMKPYYISEYCGHMYPSKMWDEEQQRLSHALRHANVLNDIQENDDIAGGTGWCMFDYNTHKNFGSGDGVCYHGVMDMFRNPKLAAAVYKSQTEQELVCEVSSDMNIGACPAGKQGDVCVFTNADSIRLYRDTEFIKEFYPNEMSYGAMAHPPILIDDWIGGQMAEKEGLSENIADQLKMLFREMQENGMLLSVASRMKYTALLKLNALTEEDAMYLYKKYITDWKAAASGWHFIAVKDGQVVKEILKAPASQTMLRVMTDRQILVEENSYDVATVHIEAVDENGNHLYDYQEPLMLKTEGNIEIAGPSLISMRGGYAGTYVRSMGHAGAGKLIVSDVSGEAVIEFKVVTGQE